MSRLIIIVVLIGALGLVAPGAVHEAQARKTISVKYTLDQGCSSGWYVYVTVYNDDGSVNHRDEGCYER